MEAFEPEIPPERLNWFIHLRWGAVAGALIILLVGPWLVPLAIQYEKVGACVVALGLLNAAYLAYWERLKSTGFGQPGFTRKVGWFLHFQMAADLVLLTFMLFLSGGAENPLLLFYLFHIAISAILFPVRESFGYAVLAVLLPWFLYCLQVWGLVGENLWAGISGLSPAHEQAILWAFSVTIGGLWFFLSRLSADLRAKEKSLKETGLKLQQANEGLQQLDVYKNRFLKQVVFQLKSPAIEMDFDLSAVESALPAKNAKAQEAVQKAKKRIWTLLELIEDLTWLSGMEAGDIPLKKEWVNVYETLLQRIQAQETPAKAKGIELQLHGDSQVRLLADQASFEKVADNLLSNAVKYTPAGESQILVDFKVEGNWMLLTVEDHGIGIPPKQQKKLFQEFFRATNAKTLEKFGTGLGLSIVKQVIDRHGGKVTLTSEPQKGTKVETWWPFSVHS